MKTDRLKSFMLQTKTLLLTTVVVCALAGSAFAGTLPGHANAFGSSLAEWQELFWRWAFGDVSLPTDNNGNATAGKNVVLMPLPDAPGDGTPGSIDVTLNVGQAFVLPLWNVLGTSYDDGTPNDPALPLSLFQTLDITLTIDGATVVTSANVMDYYTAFAFDPAIALPAEWSPYEAIVWLQGIAVTHTPLSKGQHTITLDVKNTEPVIDGMGNEYVFEFHNTWHVTVKTKK
ncbi:MAG: hypothetical protein KIS67_25015 [Verrucomicrobiae bacterium]|nr:hypothetical protein [Verrucomicrobiae bacterium]